MREKMLAWYMKQEERGKTIFWLLTVFVFVFLCLCPLFFFYDIKGYSYPVGWVLGSLVAIFAYISFDYQSKALSPSSNAKSPLIAILFMGLRFVGYAASLVISAICTFKNDLFAGFSAFNFFTTMAALVAMPFLLLLIRLCSKGKKDKAPAKEDDKQ